MSLSHEFIFGWLWTCQAQEPGQRANGSKKSVKDVGLDAMTEAFESPANWPQDFERQQQAILELWQTCNVSLVHRTYFFLLFKGDPTDSIYMEVEVRRLSYLKENFSRGNQAVEHGRTLTLSSRYFLSFSSPYILLFNLC